MHFNPIWPVKEGGGEVPALISTIDVHGIVTKSGEFSQNILENKIREKIVSKALLFAIATQFLTLGLTKFGFFSIFLQILTKYS